MTEPAIVSTAPTQEYILGGASDRDRMFIVFDLWRQDFHRQLDHALTLGGLSTDPAAARWRMLDVCCGEALLSADVLERFPLVRAVALDRDPEAVAAARIAYAPLPNLRVYLRDAHEPLPAELEPGIEGSGGKGFDFALLRLALTHLADGAAVVRNIASVLKPGGVLLMFDPVLATYERLQHPSFRALNEIICETWRRYGTYDAGNQHARLVKDAGMEVLESAERSFDVGGDTQDGRTHLTLAIETLASMRKGLVERSGVVPAEVFDEHIRRLRTECGGLSSQWCFRQTIARKPA
jgi:SAM-dependent methyltransferase